MAHAAGAGGASADRLHGPLVGALLRRRVSAGGARVLLDVVRGAATATAQRVRLVVALTKRGRTLRHLGS